MLTWSQLGIHAKPIGVLNVDGYYDALVGFIGHARNEGFIGAHHAALMMVESEPEALLRRLLPAE
jgi:predicted Rossmann-fold nucleotide-binding protein